MFEYVFFQSRTADEFVRFVRAHGLEPELEREADLWQVRLPDTAAPELLDAAESLYDDLLSQDRAAQEAEDAAGGEAAGVVVELADGRKVYAPVEPDVLARVLEVLTPQELGRMVEAIVSAVENPDDRSLCRRVENDGVGDAPV